VICSNYTPESTPPTDKVKVWPALLLYPVKCNRTGAARLWTLARTLDPSGSGWVGKADLYGYLSALGVSVRNRQRWLRDALELGIMRRADLQGNRRVFYLAGLAATAKKVGCSNVGTRPVSIAARALASKGWQRFTWVGYLATFKRKQISRLQLERLSGVSPRTQLNYDRGLITKKHNFSIGPGADHLPGLREHTPHRAAFIHEPSQKIWWRLPDIRTVAPDVAEPLSKGRSKKVNAILRSSNCGAAFLDGADRLFFDGQRDADQAAKRYGRADNPDVREVYSLTGGCASYNLWSAVAVGGQQPC
jgi:hypothetical protein